MSTRSNLDESDNIIDQMYELNATYTDDISDTIIANDNELDRFNSLEHALLMKLFILKYGVKVGHIQIIIRMIKM